jgi:hypothetical protein
VPDVKLTKLAWCCSVEASTCQHEQWGLQALLQSEIALYMVSLQFLDERACMQRTIDCPLYSGNFLNTFKGGPTDKLIHE